MSKFKLHYLVLGLSILLLTACGGGEPNPPPAENELIEPEITISGSAVKGPLAKAKAEIFLFDESNPTSFQSSTPIVTGITNDRAEFEGLELGTPENPLNPPYIMVVTATSETLDLTTGKPPVITTLKTIITEDAINNGLKIFATPLTTLSVELAIDKALSGTGSFIGNDFDNKSAKEKFVSALNVSSKLVLEKLGFGLDSNNNLFNLNPLLDEENTDASTLEKTFQYRAAIESLSAIAFSMAQELTDVSTDQMLLNIVSDLNDENIDGKNTIDSEDEIILSDTSLAKFVDPPEELLIPNSDKKVSDVKVILQNETPAVNAQLPDINLVKPIIPVIDKDLDGISDLIDNCPNIENALQENNDDDAMGDACDSDDDNDTLADTEEQTLGTDPFNSDSDADSVGDAADNCPIIANQNQENNDNDNQGDACDDDDDNDSVSDSAEQVVGSDPFLADTDGDNVGDATDNCPANANSDQLDTDADNIGDVCDPINNTIDNDSDDDGVNDDIDNCPSISNQNQLNSDNDNLGNACDEDDDNDTVSDLTDNCPVISNTDQLNTDNDAFGNACDDDDDNDTVLDINDNCPLLSNIDQTDINENNVGDACDTITGESGLYLDVSINKSVKYLAGTATQFSCDDAFTVGEVDNRELTQMVFNETTVTLKDTPVGDFDATWNANTRQITFTVEFDFTEDDGTHLMGEMMQLLTYNPTNKSIIGTVELDITITPTSAENTPPFLQCKVQQDITYNLVTDENDYDSDNINNTVDNCSLTPNQNQEDVDKDGIGDACDDSNVLSYVVEATVQSISNTGEGNIDCSDIGILQPGYITRLPIQITFNEDTLIGGVAGTSYADLNYNAGDNSFAIEHEYDFRPDVGIHGTNTIDAILDTNDNSFSGSFGNEVVLYDESNSNNFASCSVQYEPFVSQFVMSFDDYDGDGVHNNIDNCPLEPNSNQIDVDEDDVGDACDDFVDTTNYVSTTYFIIDDLSLETISGDCSKISTNSKTYFASLVFNDGINAIIHRLDRSPSNLDYDTELDKYVFTHFSLEGSLEKSGNNINMNYVETIQNDNRHCKITHEAFGLFQTNHTGEENYTGIYNTNYLLSPSPTGAELFRERSSIVDVRIENNIVQLFDHKGEISENSIVNEFDPTTGIFTLEGQQIADTMVNENTTDITTLKNTISGLMIDTPESPGDISGEIHIREEIHIETFNNPVAEGDDPISTSTSFSQDFAYVRRTKTKAIHNVRSQLNSKGEFSKRVRVMLASPKMYYGAPLNDTYYRVTNENDVTLCEDSFLKRYQTRTTIRDPLSITNINQIVQAGTHGLVGCDILNDNYVFSADNIYKIKILTKSLDAETIRETHQYIPEQVASFKSIALQRSEFTLNDTITVTESNNGYTRYLETDNPVPLDDISISWNQLNSVRNYVIIFPYDPLTQKRSVANQYRIEVSSNSAEIPKSFYEYIGPFVFKIVAAYQDDTGNSTVHSGFVLVKPNDI